MADTQQGPAAALSGEMTDADGSGSPSGDENARVAGVDADEDGEILAGPVVIVLDDPGWRRIPLAAFVREAAEAAFDVLGLPARAVTFNLMATDDEAIRALNARFRGKDRPTNVLSWPAVDRAPAHPGGRPRLPGAEELLAAGEREGERLFLGDLAIARKTVLREAEAAGKPVADHLRHLVIHGLLHLLGYDHETKADAERMEGLERRILARLGIPDPYAASGAEPASRGGEGGR